MQTFVFKWTAYQDWLNTYKDITVFTDFDMTKDSRCARLENLRYYVANAQDF